jgi:chorismate synthase
MAGNIFGSLFQVVTFGESHGPALGCVIDGCPAGVPLTTEDIARDLRRRRPGGGAAGTTARAEEDAPEILSGVFEGKTLGTPIAILIRNNGQQPADYDAIKDVYRPGHADWTWEAKYGFRDHRGGGRSSGRETAARVAAGAVAKTFLAASHISAQAWVSQAAGIDVPLPAGGVRFEEDMKEAGRNGLFVPGRETAKSIESRLEYLAEAGDSAGGVVSCRISGVPPGLGEPVFAKLFSLLGEAILSIGGCKGVDFGAGFGAASLSGSETNDRPLYPPEKWRGAEAGMVFLTNHSGGSLGGISNGMDISFRAAFKPVASISQPQKTVNRDGRTVDLKIAGRHDVCIVPRAVPVVEAMSALVIADLLLLQRGARI